MIDTVVVNFLCLIDAPVYPLAREVAALIYERPEEWSLSEDYMSHPNVGRVYNSGCILIIFTQAGRWQPTWLERCIIRKAIDWRIRTYVKNQIYKALAAKRLT